jgi:predicted ATPase/class 3 adenylate cyclase
MRCPNCQTVNPLNAKYCLECGNRLVVCPTCGTINLPIAKFCIECGTPLANSLTILPSHTPTMATSVTPTRTLVDQSDPDDANDHATVPDLPAAPATPSALLPPEERRVVTVMFADIIGSTPLADRLDPEDMRAILTSYFNLMTEQIRKHGGTVEKYIGDAVMAIFGEPMAHEDDPDRAIRAALDMQSVLKTFNEQRLAEDATAARLQMRIGINTGEVATPGTTQHQRQDFLITGDAVNVAARLQQVAAPDTILVGERTYLATRGMFDVLPMAPLRVKGKPEPITSYVVLGLREQTPIITQPPRSFDGKQTPLVGRQLELTLMHANYARVQAERHPHLITLLGVPGIGKTRLVREFIAREQETLKSSSAMSTLTVPLILMGRCPPYGEGITYWPLVEIIRSLLYIQEEDSIDTLQQRFTQFVADTLTKAKRSESTGEVVSPILRSIGGDRSNSIQSQESPLYNVQPRRDIPSGAQRSPYSPAVKRSGTQVELLRAWRVLLEALAQQQPLILVVDDLQWADEALLDLLEYLTDRITTAPILFLCPARPDFFERRRDWGGGRRNFTTIELESLSPEEANELIDLLLNTDDLPEVLRHTILARTEGNPFYVEEIIRMLIDQGILVCVDDKEHNSICWRLRQHEGALLSELTTHADHPDDTLFNMHYILPLPRVPDTIQGVLAARVDLLNSIEKLVLQRAAIIGRTFWLSSLQELMQGTSRASMLAALQSLIQRDFIIETRKQVHTPIPQDRIFSFKHILIRDVVYNNIPRTRRCQEHARLALWLEKILGKERERFVELLSYHYQQALLNWSIGLGNIIEIQNGPENAAESFQLTRPELRQRAIAHLLMAGDQALHSYYTIRALQAYHDAAELLTDEATDQATRIKMHERLGAAYAQRGNLDAAWQEYRKALQAALTSGTAADTATLYHLYAHMAALGTRWSGSFDTLPDAQEVWGYIDAGLRLIPEQPISSERVALLTYQAFWYAHQLETATQAQKIALAEQALTSGHTALRLAEELNQPIPLSLALDALSFIYTEYHKYNEAHDMQHRRQKQEQFLTSREELYDLYMSLGYSHEQVGDYATALIYFGRAWNNAQTMENPQLLLNSLVGRMRTWRQWNRWDEAQEVAQEILHLIERYQQDEKRQFWALETLATIAYRRGDQERGDQYARQCKRLVDQQIARVGGKQQQQLATRMHAIHLASEDWERATADYKEKLQASEPMPSPEVLSALAELLVTTGEDSERQNAICERAVQVAQESGARKSLAIALRARGRMYQEQQQWNLAENDLRQALLMCEALDLPWERGNTLYQLGLFYRRRATLLYGQEPQRRIADLSRARYHFEQALGFFEATKAKQGAERTRLALMQDTQPPI